MCPSGSLQFPLPSSLQPSDVRDSLPLNKSQPSLFITQLPKPGTPTLRSRSPHLHTTDFSVHPLYISTPDSRRQGSVVRPWYGDLAEFPGRNRTPTPISLKVFSGSRKVKFPQARSSDPSPRGIFHLREQTPNPLRLLHLMTCYRPS